MSDTNNPRAFDENFSICDWLTSLGLGQYAGAFSENEITPDLLFSLNDSDLEKCGIVSLGQRKRILIAIEQLKIGEVPQVADISAQGGRPEPMSIPAPSEVLPAKRGAMPSSLLSAPSRPSKDRPSAVVPKDSAVQVKSGPANLAGGGAASAPVIPIKNSRSFLDRFGGRFLYISVIFHVIFGLTATWFVVQRIEGKRKLSFQAGKQGPNPSSRMIEHKVQMTKKKNTMSAPAQARRITTAAISAKVAIPSMPMPMTNEVSASRMIGTGGAGASFGPAAMGSGVRSGVGGPMVPFFGLRTQAKRIAFLVDYSGSMSGPFRATMEKEFERCLHGLSQGTQVLIIPWAGPAWLLNQQATQIAGKWQRLDNQYDNFNIRDGEKLDPPQWVSINSESAAEMVKQLQGQKSAPGGTDWRSPFSYVMQAAPAPDVIFFMTDGQIPPQNIQRALSSIDQSLHKSALHVPQVNCLWIYNTDPVNRPETLKKLASKYHGEFVEVGKP